MITIFEECVGHEEGMGHWFSGPDSVGGFSVKLSFRNDFNKTIKYIYFGVAAYNSVGDFVKSEIPGQNGMLQYTGPLSSGATAYGRIWDNCFYNWSIKGVKVLCAVIEFMDGTKETLKEFKRESAGCYIATCVYGSYDCPEVWTLRRYRDYTLSKTWLGKLFIKIYYKLSPKLVKKYGDKEWFKNFWKKRLDKKVEKLKNIGVENTPYQDKH